MQVLKLQDKQALVMAVDEARLQKLPFSDLLSFFFAAFACKTKTRRGERSKHCSGE